MRGPAHAWANARRLQSLLAGAGIAYRHRRDLAPGPELRAIQYAEDARRGEAQRSRTELGAAFRAAYEDEVLAHADLAALAATLPAAGVTALLCVEREPAACHRSVLSARLAALSGAPVRHLMP